jgi:hypothetical protein
VFLVETAPERLRLREMMPDRARSQTERSVEQLLELISSEELREVIVWAAQWHEDVERRLRLVAARANGDLEGAARRG